MAASRFAGLFNAMEYAYGCGPMPPGALVVDSGTAGGAAATVVNLAFPFVNLADGTVFNPLNTNATINIGVGANAETVTVTAVTSSSVYGQSQVSGVFLNAHGTGDHISSGTFGLQEAINAANARGGGVVIVDGRWASLGGTSAILAAASLPSNNSVMIQDNRGTGLQFWSNRATGTVIAAPAAATALLVASQTGVTGTWTAITEHVLFTYVTATGGETLASSDYSFTATVSLAIGGAGPAAATGAVGYKVYIGANATTTCYQVPCIAANGTVIQCGPVACFQIGTPFSVATATTAAGNLIPTVSSAFGTVISAPNGSIPPPFPNVTGPYAATGTLTYGTAIEWGRVPLPKGYLNYIGRTLRISFDGYYTPASTATLIINVIISSVYGTTNTTVFTVTTPASTGTSAANINGTVYMETVSTGSAGTVECHGTLIYGGATGTAGLLVSAGDSVQAASSAADLTAQDFLIVQINAGAANLTTSQLRKFRIEVLA